MPFVVEKSGCSLEARTLGFTVWFRIMFNGDDDDDDGNKPVRPTWAVGVLSGVRDVETYNRGRPCWRSLRITFGSEDTGDAYQIHVEGRIGARQLVSGEAAALKPRLCRLWTGGLPTEHSQYHDQYY